ncbi:MAG: lysylphosphatidylglycerol synthase transmembrane domain-containing protein [Flavobacteriales bacterium]
MKKALKIIIPLLIGVGLIYYQFSSMTPEEFDEMKTSVLNADYSWMVLSIFLGILSHISRAMRWKYTTEAIGANYSLKNATFTVFISYLVNLAIPRAGEISRVALFSKYENNPFDKTLSTVVAERVVDMLLLMTLLGTVVILQFDNLDAALHLSEKFSNVGTLAITAVVGLVVAFLGWKFIQNSNIGIIVKIRTFLLGIFDGLKSIWVMKNKGLFLMHTFIIWGLYVLMFWVAIYSIPETANLGVEPIMTAFAAGGIAMAVTNGGLGAFPAAIASVLFSYGVAKSHGAAFGWVMWVSQTTMLIVCGIISFILINVMNKDKTVL